MCNIGRAISRAFTPPGTGGQIAAMEQSQQQAQNAATTADQQLTQALQQEEQASEPALDNPSAFAASQQQMRSLLAQQGAAWSFGSTPTASPPVATRVLFGS